MKNGRLALSVMCIFFNICSFLILALPAWYFSDTTKLKVNDNEIIDQSKIFLNLFQQDKLESINNNYAIWGATLDLKYIQIFNVLIMCSLGLSLLLITLSLIEIIKKYPDGGKLTHINKLVSMATLALTLAALTLASWFATNSQLIILDTETINHTISFNLSTGIYLFLIFNLASAGCGIISPSIKN